MDKILFTDLERSYDYAGTVMFTLDEIPKDIYIDEQKYYLRGIVAFIGPTTNKLRYPTGHYVAYCYRSNGVWECYDDLKRKVKLCGYNQNVNVEILFYTI